MSFRSKTWKDRISENPLRRTLTPIDSGDPVTYDVARAEGTVTEPGDPFNAANMNDLEGRIAEGIGGGEELIGPIEKEISENAYAIGDFLVFDGKFYEVIAPITVGATLTPDTNIKELRVSDIANQLVAGGQRIWFDEQNGKIGYNTDPARGADTFHPFKGYEYPGSGTSFNVSDYPGYENFTVDNFIVEPTGASIPSNFGPNPGMGENVGFWGVTGGSASVVKSYNASTGVLTAYLQASAGAGVNSESVGTSGSGGVKAYLLLAT